MTELKPGSIWKSAHGNRYRVVDPNGFCGLATGVILDEPNKGFVVILPVHSRQPITS